MEAHSFMKEEAIFSSEVPADYYQATLRHISEKASLDFCIQLRSNTHSLSSQHRNRNICGGI